MKQEALTGDLAFLECTVHLQIQSSLKIILYFIGVGFGGLEAMNSMAGFGGVGRMGGRWMLYGQGPYVINIFPSIEIFHTHT